MNRSAFYDSMKSVEKQYRAAGFALAFALERSEQDPTILNRPAIRYRDIRDCRAELESTYLVRLFAEFEAALREFWMEVRAGRELPRTYVGTLIRNVAARQKVPVADESGAHDVRDYRNALVHAGLKSTPLPFEECRSKLARFLSWLPPQL